MVAIRFLFLGIQAARWMSSIRLYRVLREAERSWSCGRKEGCIRGDALEQGHDEALILAFVGIQ